MEFTKSEAKQWAKEHFKGLENEILPSFTPDLAELDEEGIRFDVQNFIKQGFFSISIGIQACAMTSGERKKFMKIVCDEAKDKILVSLCLFVDTVDQHIEMLKHHERVGGTHALLGYPNQYYPKSEEDIYQLTKMYCDSTNLAMVLYPAQKFNFERFHRSSFPVSILSRMADIENAVGMKISMGLQPGLFAESFRLIGDRILINESSPAFWPIAIPKYGVQWAGAAVYSPSMVTLFNLFMDGELDKAMDMHWRVSPMQSPMQQAPELPWGLYNYTQWKYTQWCFGGNGGMLRQPALRLFEHDKRRIRAGIRALGTTPPEPEEEFYVGRVNYAKGARLADYAKGVGVTARA
jgi:4-hydroxy-tetrahydrodipicolinate synthase